MITQTVTYTGLMTRRAERPANQATRPALAAVCRADGPLLRPDVVDRRWACGSCGNGAARCCRLRGDRTERHIYFLAGIPRAERASEKLRDLLPRKATALRDGTWLEIDASELVPGDIVLLKAGDRISADLKGIQSHGLSVDVGADRRERALRSAGGRVGIRRLRQRLALGCAGSQISTK